MIRWIHKLIVMTCLGFAQAGLAGVGSQGAPIEVFKPEDIASFSKAVEQALAAQGDDGVSQFPNIRISDD